VATRSDFETLLNASLSFAHQMLEKAGQLAPFGVTLSSTGEVRAIIPSVGRVRPDPREMADYVRGVIRGEASEGRLSAAAVCSSTRMTLPGETEGADAILAQVESSDGETTDYRVLYRADESGEIEFGRVLASPGAGGLLSPRSPR
jgi:hypothetical protein